MKEDRDSPAASDMLANLVADQETLAQLSLYAELKVPRIASWRWLRHALVTAALCHGRLKDRF